jgi:3-oxoacyl-[acyl-carrier protein] reductase
MAEETAAACEHCVYSRAAMNTEGARALVLGGTSYLGSAVVRSFARALVPTTFTYFRSAQKAEALANEPSDASRTSKSLDVTDPVALRELINSVPVAHVPSHFVHCVTAVNAGGSANRALADVTDADWERLHAVNVRSAFVAAQALAARMLAGSSMVFTAVLDGTRPVPAPAHFAATQGALAGLVRALAKELGPAGIRVNLVVSGVLEDGVARDLNPSLRADYTKFSAMGRVGTADEVAKAILWLSLHNTYMTGTCLTLDGGL